MDLSADLHILVLFLDLSLGLVLRLHHQEMVYHKRKQAPHSEE